MVEDLIKAINHFMTVFSFRRMRKRRKTYKSYRSGTYKYQLNTFFLFLYTKKMIIYGMNHNIRLFSERRKLKLFFFKKKENKHLTT